MLLPLPPQPYNKNPTEPISAKNNTAQRRCRPIVWSPGLILLPATFRAGLWAICNTPFGAVAKAAIPDHSAILRLSFQFKRACGKQLHAIVHRTAWRFHFSVVDKSIAPYRQCSGCGEVRLPCFRSGALWIRRFGLNRVGIWQGNCSMGIQCNAADSDIDLCRKVPIAALALMACSMQIALPNRTTSQLPAKRGLVQIAYALSHWHTWRNPSFRVAGV